MKIRTLATALLLIMALMGFLHWFVYSMAVLSLTQPSPWLLGLFIFGWIMTPGALLLNMSPLKARMLPLIMAGYVWMGSFMILFFFANIQFALLLLGIELDSRWILYVTPVIALYSLRVVFLRPKVVRHVLKGPKFLGGYRMVQISDLHIGQSILGKKWLQGVVDQIQGLNPDVLVITGDLADGMFEKTVPMLEPLKQILIPKYYVTGNHEYITGGDWEKVLKDLGFEVLHNTHSLIKRAEGTLMIAGVPDRAVSRFRPGSISDPDRALQSSESVDYRVLLAHEPSSVFDIKKEKCDLVLSGHTHGGQIFPFGIFVRLQQPVSAGFKVIRGILVFAHMGTGFWGPPMRWLTRCEIVEFSWE